MRKCPVCGWKMRMECVVKLKRCYWFCERCNKVVLAKGGDNVPEDIHEVVRDDHRISD